MARPRGVGQPPGIKSGDSGTKLFAVPLGSCFCLGHCVLIPKGHGDLLEEALERQHPSPQLGLTAATSVSQGPEKILTESPH